MKPITSEWIKKAEEDYIVAIESKKISPRPNYVICFHAQQCIEKYLKAVLQENMIDFKKVHDLDILQNKCKHILPELDDHREKLIQLTVYAADVRYPGFDVEDEEANECTEIMEELRKIFTKYFSQ